MLSLRSLSSLIGVGAVLLSRASAHPCETEHFESCPEDGPSTLGKCLRGVDGKSDACVAWLDLHEACAGELKEQCSRACAGEPCAFRDDAQACLEGLDRSGVSAECAAKLPEKEQVDEEESAAMKKRRAKRSKRRKRRKEELAKNLARMKREEKEEKKKAKMKKAKKKKKKRKKKKKKKNTEL